MISAARLALAVSLSPADLTALMVMPRLSPAAVQRSKPNDTPYTAAVFLGLTNGQQFCYSASWMVDNTLQSKKLFVTYDLASDSMVVDS